MGETAVFRAVGDVAPRRPEPATIFLGVSRLLRSSDLLFGQLETAITQFGARAPHAKLAMRTDPNTAYALREAGFHVMSFAGNHCLDWGEEGFFDTLNYMANAGVALCGAGQNLASARMPAISDRGGAKVAVLAYSSILPQGYWAERTRPGCAPLRAHTSYEMAEPDQPGTPALIATWPHEGDLRSMADDIRLAKAKADIVAVSMHWGVHMTPAVIADYQRHSARIAIDAGADIILGHHPHILKGIEVYKGAPIIYSMGNFAIEQPQAFDAKICESASFKHLLSLHPGKKPEGVYVLPEDTRMSMIVEMTIADRRIVETSFYPLWIDDDSAPQYLAPENPKFRRIVNYMHEISDAAGFNTQFNVEGDRVVIAG